MTCPEAWWRFRRLAACGRFEVECRECGDTFWLTLGELERWPDCIFCAGFWRLPYNS